MSLSAALIAVFLAIFVWPVVTSAQQERREQPEQGVKLERDSTLLQMHAADMSRDLVVKRLADRARFYHGMEVEVDKGIATLSGRVPSESAESVALRIARRTPGIRSVRDELTVVTRSAKVKPKISQVELMKKVAEHIAANIAGARAGEDWWFQGWRVEGPGNSWSLVVEIDDSGTVVLEGELPNLDLIRKAILAAVEVDPVQRLDSNLEVDPKYYGYGYYPPYYHPYADLRRTLPRHDKRGALE